MDEKKPLTIRVPDDAADVFAALCTRHMTQIRRSKKGDTFGAALLLMLSEPQEIQESLIRAFIDRPKNLESIADWETFAHGTVAGIRSPEGNQSGKAGGGDPSR